MKKINILEVNNNKIIAYTTDLQEDKAIYEIDENIHITAYDFINNELVLNIEKYDNSEKRKNLRKELKDLYTWFQEYDLQNAQYNRVIRLGKDFDKDMHSLDLQAEQNAKRIKELKVILNI